jgi:sulfite exporter TauE/SafE
MTSLWLTLGILASSFFGSWHCAAMCGPIASLMKQRNSLATFHMGRLVAYLGMGIVGGSLGQIFLQSSVVMLRWISAGTLALTLILMGLSMLSPRFHFFASHGFSRFLARHLQQAHLFRLNTSGFAVGLLTAVLPCGWLYTYVLAAVATQSPWSGGLVLVMFWLGGLPALSTLAGMVRQTMLNANFRQQKIAGGILVLAGLYSVASFMFLHNL